MLEVRVSKIKIVVGKMCFFITNHQNFKIEKFKKLFRSAINPTYIGNYPVEYNTLYF